MSNISYAFIYDYRILKNVELVLDSRFKFTLDRDHKILRIEEVNPLPVNFFGEGVYSLAAIFGQNAAGKSTSMCFLMDALVEGSGYKDIDALIVYSNPKETKEEKGTAQLSYEFQIYDPKQEVESVILNGNNTFRKTGLQKINTFYYSSHFMPFTTGEDLRVNQFSGSYIATDMCRLINDIEGYSNVGTMHMTHSLSNHNTSFYFQNCYRIGRLLSQKSLVDKLSVDEIDLPRYVVVQPSDAARLSVIEKAKRAEVGKTTLKLIGDILDYYPKISDRRRSFLSTIAHKNIVNLLLGVDFSIPDIKDKLELVIYTLDYVCAPDADILQRINTIEQLGGFLNERGLSDICDLLFLLNAAYNEEKQSCFFDMRDGESVNQFNQIIDFCNKSARRLDFISMRAIDIMYVKSLRSSYASILSSGEQQMLDLFSRVYDSLSLKKERIDDTETPHAFLLDEAETGYHPEWQREYISRLTSFFHALTAAEELPPVQLVLASHSPILLSDIPLCCANFLRKYRDDEKTVIVNVRSDIKDCFAESISSLYRNAFFLENGVMGKHAETKINEIINRIELNRSTDEDLKIIGMIGDDILRRQLYKLYSLHKVDSLQDNYKNWLIDELKRIDR